MEVKGDLDGLTGVGFAQAIALCAKGELSLRADLTEPAVLSQIGMDGTMDAIHEQISVLRQP